MPAPTAFDTDVAIVGGGPAGLMLAIELGCRGVRCCLLEEDAAPPAFPKANATSARTMEHYRRRGFAERVRAAGLPAERAQDIAYRTRGAGLEFARFRIPSPRQAAAGADYGDYGEAAWPTPELPHRGNQMFIEPILLEQARAWPSVTLHLGTRVDKVVDSGDAVTLSLRRGEATSALRARYVVGCDGARSVVREALGIVYAGRGREERDFFGGQMLTLHFRSAELAALLAAEPAWMIWIVNPERRGVLIAIDGRDTWAAGIQLKPGQGAADVDAALVLAQLVGRPLGFELIGSTPWLAGYMLVAERFGAGRCFIAGDAAHLFTPTAGMGYNTSIDDAVNLGWKLAAVVQGWAPPRLLDSYEAERRPIALRNTAFAKAMADGLGGLGSPAELEDAGERGAAARSDLGRRCLEQIRREYNIPGLQLGLRYDSDIVARESLPPPPDDPNVYVADGYPGRRAPHAAEPGGRSLLDRFGRDFTLLLLGGDTDAAAVPWRAAADALGMPLQVVQSSDAAARAAYGAECALVRPDHHIAWRGALRADARAVLGRAISLD